MCFKKCNLFDNPCQMLNSLANPGDRTDPAPGTPQWGWPVFLYVIYLTYWIVAHVFLNEKFSKGGFDDWYQNTCVIAAQSSLLHFRWPLLGGFPPFDVGWGTHWPLYMVLKSAVFSILPYSETAMYSFSMIVASLCSGWIVYAIAKRTANPWLALLGGAAVLSDRMMRFHLVAARSEPLAAALLLMVVYHSRKLSGGAATRCSHLGYLLPYFLLPTLHPFGITVTGGLALVHLLYYNRLFPQRGPVLRWLPLGCYLGGLGALCLWFALQPAAWEQMRLNLSVQGQIYAEATRFTYFLNLMPSYEALLGYPFWGGGLICALGVVAAFVRSVWSGRCGPMPVIHTDLVLAAAAVVALPVIGFLLRIDNYFHFTVGLGCVVYLICSLSYSCDRRAARWLAVVMLACFAGVASLSPGYRLVKYFRCGAPDLGREREVIVGKYQSARRLYVPLCLYNEAMERCPERARMFKFPVPMPESVRRSYDNYVYSDVMPGDILIVNRCELPANDHYLNRAVRSFSPPDPSRWDFVARHLQETPTLRGGSSGWDLFVYRRK